MRLGHKRKRVMSRMGSTEEYEKRLARWNNPSKRTIALQEAPKDNRVQQLYAECQRLNKEDKYPYLPGTDIEDPYEVDHIKPIAQGGLHVFDNLRIIRRHKNHCISERPPEEIQQSTEIQRLARKGGIS
mgnify:CR=1 FL=1